VMALLTLLLSILRCLRPKSTWRGLSRREVTGLLTITTCRAVRGRRTCPAQA
jgi:hypothetical protein